MPHTGEQQVQIASSFYKQSKLLAKEADAQWTHYRQLAVVAAILGAMDLPVVTKEPSVVACGRGPTTASRDAVVRLQTGREHWWWRRPRRGGPGFQGGPHGGRHLYKTTRDLERMSTSESIPAFAPGPLLHVTDMLTNR
jgi:hypothetical protein